MNVDIRPFDSRLYLKYNVFQMSQMFTYDRRYVTCCLDCDNL